MWCPDGHGEFQPHIAACPDCGAHLTETEPSPPLVDHSLKRFIGLADQVDRAEMSLALRADEVPHSWVGTDLEVPARSEHVVNRIRHAVGPPAPDPTLADAVDHLQPGPKLERTLLRQPIAGLLWALLRRWQRRRAR